MASTITLMTKGGHHVEIAKAFAEAYFGCIKDVNALVTDDKSGEATAPAESTPLDSLEMHDGALDALVAFIALPDKSRAVTVPKPLTGPLKSIVQTDVYEWLEDNEKKDVHVDVLNLGVYLKYDQMSSVAAAYVAERMDAIAKAAPSIMEGAEDIRKFLHLKNEWSEEEMKHLKLEMDYAKEVNSSAY